MTKKKIHLIHKEKKIKNKKINKSTKKCSNFPDTQNNFL